MTEIIDLRSDTVTLPTTEMRDAMHSAALGDDVFGDDPSVNALQQKVASYFGAEDAIFCPSGTMTNQLAIMLHTRPGDEVICHEHSHIYHFEGGGIAANAGASTRLARGVRGLIQPADIDDLVRKVDIHAPCSRLLAVENTTNKGGGACYDFDTLQALKNKAKHYSLRYHLDGARLWNALVARGDKPQSYGSLFDTISVCFSKGLGCPVGSALLGNHTDIEQARRIRKRIGGGMRQAGFLAAAATYAIDHHVDRLAEDHIRAKEIATTLQSCSWVSKLEPVETNIVIFYAAQDIGSEQVLDQLLHHNIRMVSMGEGKLRAVTHLDINDAHLETLAGVLPHLF